MKTAEIDLDGVADWALEKVGKGLNAGALFLTGEIKAEISKPGQGREYKRGSRTHRASAPGQAPASDTGRLLGATLPMGIRYEADRVVTGVVANTDYAENLEAGTDKMEARPFMGATLYSRLDDVATVVKVNVT